MPSHSPAVGAETDPLRRARQLQKSWERLLADGVLGPELPPAATAGLRPTIIESWRRSLATGLDPTDLLAPIEADESEVLGRWFEHPLGSLSHVLTEQLRKVAEESRSMVVVTDASGLVLHRVGNEWLKERAAAEMNLVEGARYSEAADGTNGIGTALAADHAFQVFAFEHFNERHHQWVCSGAPVHDPVSGRVVALVDLSSLWKTAHPRSLELVTTAARTMEQRLFEVRRDQDARLRRRYGDLVTRSTDLLVNRDGYALAGAEPAHSKPLDIPEGGGEVVLGDGSLAVAASFGQGEAYLLRQVATRHAKSAPVEVLERAEKHVRQLVSEQAALRQVATLVARHSSPDQLFAAVAEQVARVFDVPHVRLVRYEPDGSVVVGGFSGGDRGPFPIGSRWPLDSPGVTATVRQTGHPARVEDYAHMTGEIAAVVRGAGMRSTVASPIVVERRLWGAIVVLSPRDEPLPEDTEARLTDFTELVATAIANAESRVAMGHLLAEQAALRRVATLVAEAAPPAEIFSAVSNEVATLFRTEMVVVGKFDGEPVALLVVGVGDGTDEPVVGSQWKLDDALASTAVYHTGLPARFDHDSPIADPDVAAVVERFRPTATVAVPIKVEGRPWGAMIVSTQDALLPTDTEERLQRFTDLIATALANAEARAEVERLAQEQAALRRLAVLVAQQPSHSEVFTAVTQAVGLLLRADLAALHVFQSDGTGMTIAGWSGDGGPIPPTGSRVPLVGDSVAARIFETGAPARIDGYAEAEGEGADLARSLRLRSTVGAPVLVEGKLWGALLAATRGVEPWAENAETRIAAFTELVATAIANAESREALAELADEQAALRRVATLVARGAPPMDLFGAVAEEVGRLHSVDRAYVTRFDSEETVTVMARWAESGEALPVELPRRFAAGPMSAAVRETRGPVRLDLAGEIEAGARSSVAAPITVDGNLWGCISAASTNPERPPAPGTEARLSNFSDLVATAIANADGRSELAASRRRIVAAADETRRRIERDLHDGTQQRLVSLGLAVRAAEANLPPDREDLRDELDRIVIGLSGAVEDLQEISRGIHPAILSKGGLGPALHALAHRSAIPVDLDITTDVRLEEPTEVAAYFVASEALANAAKHSEASRIDVSLGQRDGSLVLSVRDDGLGGAHAERGSGIVGLNDRVEALGGSLRVDSRPGKGTQMVARLPLDLELG
jgi:signal transduction histidine kinase/putative methionine-R-sulfoxide reductase with GAF domain